MTPTVLGDLRTHLAVHGPLPYRGSPRLLIDTVGAAGLTGRGGAAFPVAGKLAAVAGAGARAVVVANGAEGEPASGKGTLLLRTSPHLVLDGIQLAAEAVNATQAFLCTHHDHMAGRTDTPSRAAASRPGRARHRRRRPDPGRAVPRPPEVSRR